MLTTPGSGHRMLGGTPSGGNRRIGTGKIPIRRTIWAMLLLVCIGSLTLMISLAYYTVDMRSPSSTTSVTIIVNNDPHHQSSQQPSRQVDENLNGQQQLRYQSSQQQGDKPIDTTILIQNNPMPSAVSASSQTSSSNANDDVVIVDTTEEVEQLFGSARTDDDTRVNNNQPVPIDFHDGHNADSDHADITKFLLLGARPQDTRVLEAAFKRHRRVRMIPDTLVDKYDRHRFQVRSGPNRWWIGGHALDMLADPSASYRAYQSLRAPDRVKLLVMLRDPTRVFESSISDAIDNGLLQLDGSPSLISDAPTISDHNIAALVQSAGKLRQQMDMCLDARRRANEAPAGPTGVEEDDNKRDTPSNGNSNGHSNNNNGEKDDTRDEMNEFGERARNPTTMRQKPGAPPINTNGPVPGVSRHLLTAADGGGKRAAPQPHRSAAAAGKARRPIDEVKQAATDAAAAAVAAAARKSDAPKVDGGHRRSSPPPQTPTLAQRQQQQQQRRAATPAPGGRKKNNNDDMDHSDDNDDYEITSENTDDHTGDDDTNTNDNNHRAQRRRRSRSPPAANTTPAKKSALVNEDGEEYDVVAARGLDDYCYKQYMIDSALRQSRQPGSLPYGRKQLEALFGVLIERGCYHSQLAHWLAMWPRSNMFVFTAEQLLANPEAVLRSIMTFLGMPLPLRDDQLLTRRYGLHLTREEWASLQAASATASMRAEETARAATPNARINGATLDASPIRTAPSLAVMTNDPNNNGGTGVTNNDELPPLEVMQALAASTGPESKEWSLLPLTVRRQLVELYRPFNHKLKSLLHIELGFPRLDYSYAPRVGGAPPGWLPQPRLSRISVMPHVHREPPTTPLNHPEFRIAYVLPYLGRSWPIWFNYFLMSCSQSAYLMDILIFHQSMKLPPVYPRNVHFIDLGLRGLAELHGQQLARSLGYDSHTLVESFQRILEIYPYLLAEFKPATGIIFSPYLVNYTHWTYGDPDVILGDIPSFIERSDLTDFDILTYSHTNADRLYLRGQLSVHRNEDTINNLWKKCVHLTSKLMINLRIKLREQKLRNLHAGSPPEELAAFKNKFFISAEGCYSHVGMFDTNTGPDQRTGQRHNITVKISPLIHSDHSPLPVIMYQGRTIRHRQCTETATPTTCMKLAADAVTASNDGAKTTTNNHSKKKGRAVAPVSHGARQPNPDLIGMMDYLGAPVPFNPVSPCTGLGWFHPRYTHCAPGVINAHNYVFFSTRDGQWFQQEFRSRVINEDQQEKALFHFRIWKDDWKRTAGADHFGWAAENPSINSFITRQYAAMLPSLPMDYIDSLKDMKKSSASIASLDDPTLPSPTPTPVPVPSTQIDSDNYPI